MLVQERMVLLSCVGEFAVREGVAWRPFSGCRQRDLRLVVSPRASALWTFAASFKPPKAPKVLKERLNP